MAGGEDAEIVLELPETARAEFKDPLGSLYTDVETLLGNHDQPIVTVGDIVTYHFEETGHPPAVAYVDGRTKRETAPAEVRDRLADRRNRLSVENPAGTITADLLEATVEALAAAARGDRTDDPAGTTIEVDGEEDLATVPAVIAAPDGATVVYGQPDKGMVAVDVTADTRDRFRELLSTFDGDSERALDVLDA